MEKSYPVKVYGRPARRYCRTIDICDDPKFIAEYRRRHSEGAVWQEIIDGIREVGILEMEIYILDAKCFMIMDVVDDFDWDTAMARLATLPRQQEWEDYMSILQKSKAGTTAADKWHTMERMFHLY